MRAKNPRDSDAGTVGLHPGDLWPDRPTLEQAVARAEQALWSADAAAYYAHRRLCASDSPGNRREYQARQRDQAEALAALRREEQALVRRDGEVRA